MRYFNWLCCRVWVHVHCFFQRPYPLDNDIIFPVALSFAKKKKQRKIEKIACVAGVERWRELGGRKIGRGLCLFPCISLSPPPPFPPLPFLSLPRRLRKKWIGCLLEHRKKLYNNPRNYATAKQFLWQARSRGRGRGGSSPPRNFHTLIKFRYKRGIFLLKWTAVNGS